MMTDDGDIDRAIIAWAISFVAIMFVAIMVNLDLFLALCINFSHASATAFSMKEI